MAEPSLPLDKDPRFKSELEEFDDNRPPYCLTFPEVKLLGIAGVSEIHSSGITCRLIRGC
jgi:PHS family inorganic phosphate transporter-like MFS transporter